ncbi:hypothetical protein [Pedobacter sp. Leaf194]|uniref:hypothetical protein n=1 Tax=Pedobacter sp. Leaf194 TaxID=1736297 RepID=UPI000703709B|nr:hypothetical protein [Pedobacter sp. Leaf194]KQS36779.1 hypothetical protein ASG14_06995 [Pedobacter sp. Leaf194]
MKLKAGVGINSKLCVGCDDLFFLFSQALSPHLIMHNLDMGIRMSSLAAVRFLQHDLILVQFNDPNVGVYHTFYHNSNGGSVFYPSKKNLDSFSILFSNEVITHLRLTVHQDGWLYAIVKVSTSENCSKTKNLNLKPSHLLRTKDLIKWEMLNEIHTEFEEQFDFMIHSLHIDGGYGFYTMPQNGIANSQVCLAFATSPFIETVHIEQELIYQQYLPAKNKNNVYYGPTPVRIKEGWLNMVQEIVETSAGVSLMAKIFWSDSQLLFKVIQQPKTYLLCKGQKDWRKHSQMLPGCSMWEVNPSGELVIYMVNFSGQMELSVTKLDDLIDNIRLQYL